MTYRDYHDVNFGRSVLVPVMPKEVLEVRERVNSRHLINRALGRSNRHNWQPDTEENVKQNVVGCLGELALAKFLGVPYEVPMEYDKHQYDVAGHEVRSTLRFDGCLITHDDDKPAPYVLGLVHRISFYKFDVVLAGWIHLHDANQVNHWRDDVRCPAYFTPQTVLHPMGTLSNKRKGSL